MFASLRLPATCLAILSSLAAIPCAQTPAGVATNPTYVGISADPGGAPIPRRRLPNQPAGQVPDGPCSTIGFDNLGDNMPLGTFTTPLGIDVTFPSNWFSLLDIDAGGTGRIANEPSESTVAYYLSTAGAINFSAGIGYVGLRYSASAASLPLTMIAWDGPNGTGNQLATSMGTILGASFDGANCTGDPGGWFCLWGSLSVQAPGANILSVTLEGAMANQVGFDDLEICLFAPCATPSLVTPIPDANGLNVPDGLSAPLGSVPTIGTFDFDLVVDDPTSACSIPSGSLTQVVVTAGQLTNGITAGLGCSGGNGDLKVDMATATYLSGWKLYLGGPVVHNVPIPANSSLCGVECTAQAFFLDQTTGTPKTTVTNALLLTFGS